MRALSTSIVEQSIRSAPGCTAGEDLPPHGQHVLARRQHGDDHLGVADHVPGRLPDRDAVRPSQIQGSRHEVEADDLMAGLDQIGRHGPAHVAETNETNCRHAFSP